MLALFNLIGVSRINFVLSFSYDDADHDIFGIQVRAPRRVIPFTIVLVILVTLLCYTGVSIVITMMVPYYLQVSHLQPTVDDLASIGCHMRFQYMPVSFKACSRNDNTLTSEHQTAFRGVLR